MDYHKPPAWHPLRYLMYPVFLYLEPYALTLWRQEFHAWLPAVVSAPKIDKQTLFGGLYQRLVIIR